MAYKCDLCGKFLKNVTATINGYDEIEKVMGDCKACGKVKVTDYNYDDFINYEVENENNFMPN